METTNINTHDPMNDLGVIINDLEKEDRRNLRMSKILIWLMGGVTVLFAYYIFKHSTAQLVSKIVLVLAYLVGMTYYFNYKKSFTGIDYSLPTLQLLKLAVKRHKFLQKRLLTVIAMYFLFTIGFLFYKPELTFFKGEEFSWAGFLVLQGVLLGGIAIGFIIEYAIWHEKQKPVRDKIRELINDIEN